MNTGKTGHSASHNSDQKSDTKSGDSADKPTGTAAGEADEAATTGGSPPATATQSGEPQRSVVEITVATRTIWRIILVIALAAALFWALGAASHFVGILIISLFLALALLPGVNHIHEKYGWKRGAAVGAIYLGGFLFLALMVVVLIPSIAKLGESIAKNGSSWMTSADDWTSKRLGVHIISQQQANQAASTTASSLNNWSQNSFGKLLGFASSGVGFVFDLATVAMFTFYFTADFGRMRRYFLSFYRPEVQQRLGWTIDEAIRQTGGYFYSRVLLMGFSGTGFFLTMVIVGVPIPLALALGLFGGFVSEFIPAIGTYFGAAIPAIVAFGLKGPVAGLIVIGYALVYQQIENYWLSPRLSAKTMNLNGAVAFGAALAGGALFGPMGAFMALPMAALITSFVNNYTKRYKVVYKSGYDDSDEDQDDGDAADGDNATSSSKSSAAKSSAAKSSSGKSTRKSSSAKSSSNKS